jgi:hypothetical protein
VIVDQKHSHNDRLPFEVGWAQSVLVRSTLLTGERVPQSWMGGDRHEGSTVSAPAAGLNLE